MDILNDAVNELYRRALSLEERIQLRRDGAPSLEANHETRTETLGRQRERLIELDVWRERVSILGLDETEVLASAALHSPTLAAEQLPDIRECFLSILDFCESSRSASIDCHSEDYAEPGVPPLPPSIEAYVRAEVRTASVQLNDIDRNRFANFEFLLHAEEANILREIHLLLLPCLVTELHVASERGALEGASPQARFDSFCSERIKAKEWVSEFLVAYPMALRSTRNTVDSRLRAFVEMLNRFHRDFDVLLSSGLVASEDAKVESLTPSVGDRHRDGRAVRIFHLSGDQQLVYKPRPVEIDVAFQELLAWLNASGFEPKMLVMPVVQRQGYGWFPFIDADDAPDEDGINRFYKRHGAHLALLYLLGGYDTFSENVRAHGEFPVLIDLECVHAPLLPPYNGRLFDSAARRYLDESVYRTGLLPSWSWTYLGGDGVNLSALSDVNGQMTPQEVVVWAETGSEALHQTRARRIMHSDHLHLPTLAGKPQAVDEFTRALRAGFRGAYEIIQRHKEGLLSEEAGPLRSFSTAECRLVLRNTLDYLILLGEARHPRYFSDSMEYGLFLDRLWISRCPRYLPNVIAAETRQLWRGDVPLFTTYGGSRDLRDDAGRLVERDYFPESALEGTKRRLLRWDESDCARQLEIINCAFAITDVPHVAGPAVISPLPGGEAAPSLEGPSTQALVDEACHIGEQLLAIAVEDGRTLTWIGLGMNRAGQWEQTSLDSSLYDGGPGVAMLFLYLHAVTGNERFFESCTKILQYVAIDAAREAVANRARLEDWVLYPPSGMTFRCSALYLCLHARRFGRVVDLDVVLDATLDWARAGLKRKPRLDYLNGAAGVVRSLLVAHRELGDPRCLEMAERYGDLILQNAIPLDKGLAWTTEGFPHPLGGFSHGSGGISWVLADLAASTGSERYKRAAWGALRFDRSLFSADREEWFDLRESPDKPGTAVHWCHGVSGIGLGRLLFSRYLPETDLSRDFSKAIEITLEDEQTSDCLCHGELGNIDICRIAAEFTNNPDWKRRTDAKLARAWHAARARRDWRSGLPSRTLGICGMFMGTAGIGYALLRQARPDIVPSVLYLEEPKRPLRA